MSYQGYSNGISKQVDMSPFIEEHDAFDEDIDLYDYETDNHFDGIKEVEQDSELEDELHTELDDSFYSEPFDDEETDQAADELSDYDELED